MRVDMQGITKARTGFEPLACYPGGSYPKKTAEEWFRLSCEIALSFGAKLRHECHGGVRAEFPGDHHAPSLVIWSTGFWYDHRGGDKGGTLELHDHLSGWRGLTQISSGPVLDDAAFRELWRASYGFRRATNPEAGQDRWNQLSWAPGDQQETVFQYFHYRGLHTDWCYPEVIRTRNLQNTEIEQQHAQLGADFLFAVPYHPYSRFLPARERDPHWDRISGMQRTFLAHPVDEYHPARKTGRAMAGPAGMSRIVVPTPAMEPNARIEADFLALAALAPDARKRLFYSEGLESGLTVGQVAGGILHCLWSSTGFKKLAEAILDSEGAILPDDPESVHILLVDRDPNRAGENAAQYLYRTLRLVGRRVLFLLPPAPEGVEGWVGDWNDVLMEGRMATALPQAIAESEKNLQEAPIVPTDFGWEKIERIERPKIFKGIEDVRAHIETRGYLNRMLPQENAQGGELYVDTTGAGKTSHLARLQPPTWAKKTCITTPQRRDAQRIAKKNHENDGEFFPRNSRTNTMAHEHDTAAIIGDAVDDARHMLWTNDSNHRVSRADYVFALKSNALPACYRNALPLLTITEKGIASFAKGEMHPDQLAAQRQGTRQECTRCPHGKAADIRFRAEQKPQEAKIILEELDQLETYRGNYYEENQETASVQSAPLRFFLPCPAELNRQFSYREEIVCTTTQCLDKDKRLLGQMENIHQDEEPELTETVTIDSKKMHEFGLTLRRAIAKTEKKIASNRTEEPERKKLEKELEGAKLTIQAASFIFENFFGMVQKNTPQDMHALLESESVQTEIVQPFVQWATKNIQHQAPFESPYPSDESDPQSFRYIPPVLTRALADALQHHSFRFSLPEADAPEMICCFPTSFGEMVRQHKENALQKSLRIYSATPSKVLWETLKRDENFADDRVHLEWIPHTHYKAAFQKNAAEDTKSAWKELWHYWQQGLKVAFLTDKKRAQALRRVAKKHKPEWAELIGWIGKHHIAHDHWSDCDGLIIWSLDLPSIQVLAQEMAFQNRIFGMGWQDVDLYKNHWESASEKEVEFPHLGIQVPAMVFDHADLDAFVRFRVSQILSQSIGRLRGVNHTGAQKFCRVYSAIPPIDGLFGTFIDEIPAVAKQSNALVHQMHVSKVAQAIARTLVLPESGQHSLLDAVIERRLTVREIQELAQESHIGFQAKHLREILDAVIQHLPNVKSYDIRKQGTRIFLRQEATIGIPGGDGAESRLWATLEQLVPHLQPGGCLTVRTQDLLQAEGLEARSYTEYQQMLQRVGRPLLQETLERLAAAHGLQFGEGFDDLTPVTWIAMPSAATTPPPSVDAEKGEQEQASARVMTPLKEKGSRAQHTHKPLPEWIRALLTDPNAQPVAPYVPTLPSDALPHDLPVDTITLSPSVLTGQTMAHAGGNPALERLAGDPEDRQFPTFIAMNYLWVLARITRDLERSHPACAQGIDSAPPEFTDYIQHRIGLEYRRQWVESYRAQMVFRHNPVLESLEILIEPVNRYLAEHPECLDITQALDAAADDLRSEIQDDPMIRVLLNNWLQNPVLPRLDLSKPLFSVRIYYQPKEFAA